MPKLLKKFLFSFFASLVVLFSFAPYFSAAKAQTWYDQSPIEWFNKVYDPSNPSEIFGERYTAAQVQWIIYSLFFFVVPDKPLLQCITSGDLSNCLTVLKTQLKLGDASLNPSLPAKHESLASLVFASDRPLSFISYAKSLGQKYSLVSEVHAQTPGFGFQALSVIQSLWTAARNFTYVLFVIVAIVFAFMIMFRVKISPQLVVSVQSAIPKIITALILVTFSYAIAGLLVDLMYVVIGFLSLALASVGGSVFATDPTTIFKFLTTGYIGINSSLGVSAGIFGLLLLYILVFSLMCFAAIFAIGGGIVGAVLTLGILPALATLIGLIVFVVMLIVIIFLGLKIGWMLIKAFAQVLLLTIVAPFQIALGTIVPGLGFGSWLKAFVANLAVFPVTGLLFALSFVFLLTAGNILGGALVQFNWWQLLGVIIPGGAGLGTTIASNTGWPPLLGVSSAMLGFAFVGVSFMIFTLIPKAGDVIKGFISGRPFAYGTAIGEAFGPAKVAWGLTGRPYTEGFGKELGRTSGAAIGKAIAEKFQQSTARPSSGEKK
jgi:hypothetical protein